MVLPHTTLNSSRDIARLNISQLLISTGVLKSNDILGGISCQKLIVVPPHHIQFIQLRYCGPSHMMYLGEYLMSEVFLLSYLMSEVECGVSHTVNISQTFDLSWGPSHMMCLGRISNVRSWLWCCPHTTLSSSSRDIVPENQHFTVGDSQTFGLSLGPIVTVGPKYQMLEVDLVSPHRSQFIQTANIHKPLISAEVLCIWWDYQLCCCPTPLSCVSLIVS